MKGTQLCLDFGKNIDCQIMEDGQQVNLTVSLNQHYDQRLVDGLPNTPQYKTLMLVRKLMLEHNVQRSIIDVIYAKAISQLLKFK
jgi:hypothetical protein